MQRGSIYECMLVAQGRDLTETNCRSSVSQALSFPKERPPRTDQTTRTARLLNAFRLSIYLTVHSKPKGSVFQETSPESKSSSRTSPRVLGPDPSSPASSNLRVASCQSTSSDQTPLYLSVRKLSPRIDSIIVDTGRRRARMFTRKRVRACSRAPVTRVAR